MKTPFKTTIEIEIYGMKNKFILSLGKKAQKI